MLVAESAILQRRFSRVKAKLLRLRKAILASRLQLISFITGFCLLTFELAAARVLAPSIGSSTYVWTGVIGVIIAALSLGFFIGGKLADTRNRTTDLVWLLVGASILAVLTLLSYEGILQSIVDTVHDSRVQAVIAALTLFAPTSFFIGMTSPYLAKLNVTSLKSTGQAIASLDMLNAIGGIVGTFVTGFILFGYIGAYQAIGIVAVLLLLASWLIAPRTYTGRRLIASVILILTALTPPTILDTALKIDTASAHYEVIRGFIADRPVVGLVTGPSGTQSAVFANGNQEPVFWYTQEMSRLTVAENPTSVLILGGGAFTLPEYLSKKLPDARIDVVEIDPELETISREHFGYTNPSNVNEIFSDARTFVNQSKSTYDVILVDVYGDTTIPFTFITKEYAESLSKLVAPGGIVFANVIGGLTGECSDALYAVDAAYQSSFAYSTYSRDPSRDDSRANYILAYSADSTMPAGLVVFEPRGDAPYTDNYAPAERLYYKCQQTSYK